MVIRRIREHAATHNWFAVAIDLAIVVLGVFLGIQASNWNEARLDAERADSYRRRLIDELDFNIRHHRQQLGYYRQVLGHGRAALAAIESGRGDDTQLLIDALQLTQVDTQPAKSYIYQEMISAGLVGGIGSEEVQQAASDYYVQVSATDRELLEEQPYRYIARSLIPYATQAQLQEKCGDRPVYDDGRVIGLQLPAKCRLTLDPAMTAASVAELRREPNIKREMVRYLGSIHERVQALETSLLLGGRLQKSLRPMDGVGGESSGRMAGPT